MFYLDKHYSMFIKIIAAILVFTLFSLGSPALATGAVKVSAEAGASNSEVSKLTTANTLAIEEPSTEIVLNNKPLLYQDIKYEANYSVSNCDAFLNTINISIDELNDEIASGDYTESAIKAMDKELYRLTAIADRVEAESNKISKWYSEYPCAAEVWTYLHERGYSDVIVCAIIGNMMVETVGGTLAIDPDIYDDSNGYYGLCQWSVYYNPNVANKSMKYQLDYLCNTIEKEFRTFGKCYYRGFTYEDFISMTNPADAAKAFAAVYERCATWSYSPRCEAASVAYDYFNFNK